MYITYPSIHSYVHHLPQHTFLCTSPTPAYIPMYITYPSIHSYVHHLPQHTFLCTSPIPAYILMYIIYPSTHPYSSKFHSLLEESLTWVSCATHRKMRIIRKYFFPNSPIKRFKIFVFFRYLAIIMDFNQRRNYRCNFLFINHVQSGGTAITSTFTAYK
jgi:hypothetical protein